MSEVGLYRGASKCVKRRIRDDGGWVGVKRRIRDDGGWV